MGRTLTLATATALATLAAPAGAETLRLMTWGGYAPDAVIDRFEEETGHDVEVTLSNNEEMIAKLRATGGGGFDLVQPSQDRISGPQAEFGLYRPIDMERIDAELFVPSMLEATRENTTVDGEVYGVPHVWGTSGLIVNAAEAPDVADYTDLCDESLEGRVTYRLKRATLIGFGYAMGMDPFAAYDDPDAYGEMLDEVEAALIDCKPIVRAYWSGGDEVINLMRSGETVAAMAWDTGGWKLNADNPDIDYVAPASGALGWVDTFALPAQGRAEDAAYAWINFVMRPEIAAMITDEAGNFTASAGADEFVADELKARYRSSFPPETLDNIRWYPPVPAEIERMEGEALDRIQAAG